MNRRISLYVADALSHPAGFLAFNIFTAVWFASAAVIAVLLGAPIWAVVVVAMSGYLDVVTYFSGVTQFTLALQNREAAQKLDRVLALLVERIDDVGFDQNDDRALLEEIYDALAK